MFNVIKKQQFHVLKKIADLKQIRLMHISANMRAGILLNLRKILFSYSPVRYQNTWSLEILYETKSAGFFLLIESIHLTLFMLFSKRLTGHN